MKLTKAQKEVIQKMREANSAIIHANRDYMMRFFLCDKILSGVVVRNLISKGILQWTGINYRLSGYGKTINQ